jgi:hypothetical protein
MLLKSWKLGVLWINEWINDTQFSISRIMFTKCLRKIFIFSLSLCLNISVFVYKFPFIITVLSLSLSYITNSTCTYLHSNIFNFNTHHLTLPDPKRWSTVTFYTSIREVLGLNLSRDTSCFDRGFSWLSWVLPGNFRGTARTIERLLPSKSLPIH